MDVSATYRAAIRTSLPHTRVVGDHFHVTQLANKMLSAARRRTTAEVRGRRGRATDPKWSVARRRCAAVRTSPTSSSRRCGTRRRGAIGQQTLLTTWIAKENLRSLLALAGTGADRNQVDHPRWKFPTWCADSDIPKVRQFTVTVDR
ncbi:transposase [Streptomyces sp. WSLK1-5]|uniref:transposase n=1 Tax=unclassified Streptomyces TaxID=2593676 RepID=UPI0037A6C10F